MSYELYGARGLALGLESTVLMNIREKVDVYLRVWVEG